MNATSTQSADKQCLSPQEWRLRVDLAAAFRLAVHFDWHESVGNHFSAALTDDGRSFLLNPRWKHFSKIRASDSGGIPGPWSRTVSTIRSPRG